MNRHWSNHFVGVTYGRGWRLLPQSKPCTVSWPKRRTQMQTNSPTRKPDKMIFRLKQYFFESRCTLSKFPCLRNCLQECHSKFYFVHKYNIHPNNYMIDPEYVIWRLVRITRPISSCLLSNKNFTFRYFVNRQ